ncbi:NmrA family NAD(P)-binding protein [Fibrella aquatilis]|uniref:NmrA family NAD(P)-binding protein n=1 Tax=Fibrella aquatilis TaxID=2817059 RepID=A0A939GDS2_9BACT|nr:NmrA family NAD(P)-binding protein [Fibrella aquatilis]MBO0934851.1 NmrA family NAD(P)-binding protein [Fibrella aquatilis]
MPPTTILITTPLGNVGLETLRALATRPERSQLHLIAAVRNPDKDLAALATLTDAVIRFDFADPSTFAPALVGVDRLLLVRPPQLADVDHYFRPFIEAVRYADVQQLAFLSLQGVESNSLTPHHKIEQLIVAAGIPYTFLRPSFFMQNLSTTHRAEIADRDEIYIPAGNGRTSLIDVVDIGEVAALVLTDGTGHHLKKGYELTGSEALTYYEMAQTLTAVLGRTITYKDPSVLAFIWRNWRKEKMPLSFVLIMVALYTVSKLGKAAGTTSVFQTLTGHAPRTFRQFAEANRGVWQR